MTIGLIGLGNMGLPIAKNLLHAGFSIKAYNRSEEKRKTFESWGGRTASNLEEVSKGSDIIISMLTNDDAVKEVSSQILPFMKPGSIHISMSTISPETATILAESGAQRGIKFLAAPVLGRPPAAEAKQLFILLSGDSQAKKAVESIWPAISQKVFDFGNTPTTAKTVKLIMNYMIFVTTGMLSEAMLVAEKGGIDKRTLHDTMMSTVFGSPIVKNYGNMIIEERENSNGFATALASKDLRLMQETASALNLNLPLGELMQQHFKDIIAKGEGAQDVPLLVRHLREVIQK